MPDGVRKIFTAVKHGYIKIPLHRLALSTVGAYKVNAYDDAQRTRFDTTQKAFDKASWQE